jgi:tetratricopeptide (TPR) repeat protein
MQSGEPLRAREYFEQARNVLPDDPATLFGLGQCLFELNDLAEVDELLLRVIDLSPTGEIGEAAKKLRTKIAAANFRKPDMPRMDAVMYCLSALQLFSEMPVKQVKEIAFEIALLGRSGLDVNNSEPKYSLKTIPGRFSGLHLVAYMYVAFKKVAPEIDGGFDLSSEYALACQMHGKIG